MNEAFLCRRNVTDCCIACNNRFVPEKEYQKSVFFSLQAQTLIAELTRLVMSWQMEQITQRLHCQVTPLPTFDDMMHRMCPFLSHFLHCMRRSFCVFLQIMQAQTIFLCFLAGLWLRRRFAVKPSSFTSLRRVDIRRVSIPLAGGSNASELDESGDDITETISKSLISESDIFFSCVFLRCLRRLVALFEFKFKLIQAKWNLK